MSHFLEGKHFMDEEKRARIGKAIADHDRRVAKLLDLVRHDPQALPDFFEHVTDEYQLKQFDGEGNEVDTHLSPERILSAQAWAYLASDNRFTGREHVIFKTALPRELKLAADSSASGLSSVVLLCRMIWLEAKVSVFHPAIEEIWGDIIPCLDAATQDAGERVLLSPGKPRNAWFAFAKSFFPMVKASTGLDPESFRLRLEIAQRRGKWFVFEE